MALWIILGIILILVISFFILRIGISLEYSDKGLEVMFHAGFIRFRLHPSPKKEKSKKTAAAKAEKKIEKTKLGGAINQFREFISIISDISEKLRKRFTIDYITLYYMAADDDAAEAAMKFGRASALAGIVLPILDNSFTVKQKDIRTAVSFTNKESYVYFKIRLSVAMRLIPYIVIIFGYRYKYMKTKAKEKTV